MTAKKRVLPGDRKVLTSVRRAVRHIMHEFPTCGAAIFTSMCWRGNDLHKKFVKSWRYVTCKRCLNRKRGGAK